MGDCKNDESSSGAESEEPILDMDSRCKESIIYVTLNSVYLRDNRNW